MTSPASNVMTNPSAAQINTRPTGRLISSTSVSELGTDATAKTSSPYSKPFFHFAPGSELFTTL